MSEPRVTVARIAYRLARQVLPKYSHPKSPHHFELPQLAACVLLMFYLKLSYREMEEWLLATDKVCAVLGLSRIPDHSTLQRTYKKLRKFDLTKMKDQLLQEVGLQPEGVIASDSTGFSPTQASLYSQSRSGRRGCVPKSSENLSGLANLLPGPVPFCFSSHSGTPQG
jgi:hypothetical protein